jgi:YidC/Oxa1 family membrane protein insertase
MTDNRNLIIAIALSLAVIIGWQFLFARPQIQRAQQTATQQAEAPKPGEVPATGAGAPPGVAADAAAAASVTREAALAATPRVPIANDRVTGSINLKGGRIDDLRLSDYHETVDNSSPTVVLLSPSAGPQGYFAEYGWVAQPGTGVPGPDTQWTAPADAKLTPATPVTLTYDNGAGLVFSRKISIDDNYMFTIEDTVANKTATAVSLTPYGRVVRMGDPQAKGYYILHEGPIGVFDGKLNEITYKSLAKDPTLKIDHATRGWLGITDKYWAATMIPPQDRGFVSSFSRMEQPNLLHQVVYSGDAVDVAAGGTAEITNRLFAGAKQVSVVGMNLGFASVEGYGQRLGIDRFELLIDWGWFYFITKPMFLIIDWLYRFLGNFGLAILAVTVIAKGVFFPLANKSYKSMSAMKKLQPEMQAMRERYKDDKMKQQQALMELYKKEKINPLAGCWPMVIQIPVFFSLYKVLFITIEMRHAPFFGWIHDLSAPDPTNFFTLFGLIPWTPPHLLMLGIWPVIMGITMFVQMRLNPTPADPAQQVVFTWMPVIFTFMLASFPAGLVIYWAWNNTLSVIQQYVIMRRQGVEVDLWGNISSTFKRKPKKADAKS